MTSEPHHSPDKLLSSNFKSVTPSPSQKPGKRQQSQKDCEYLRAPHVVLEGAGKDNTVTGTWRKTGQSVSQ